MVRTAKGNESPTGSLQSCLIHVFDHRRVVLDFFILLSFCLGEVNSEQVQALGSEDWEFNSPITIKLVESRKGRETKFATMLNENHRDNRIGYRFFEHSPIMGGQVPSSSKEAGIDVVKTSRRENNFKSQENVFVIEKAIDKDSSWVPQKWTFYLKPVSDGVDIFLVVETFEQGLSEFYGVQQCFRLGGTTNSEWRKQIANTPAFSEYDLWRRKESDGESTSLTYVLRNGEWQEIPATPRTIGARTPLGVVADSQRSNDDPLSRVGPYDAEMLEPIDCGLITRTNFDETWVCGMHWENTTHVTNHHPADCIHSIVNIGGIPPNSKRAVRGKIYWFAGTKEDLLRRYSLDFPAQER